ncbi:PAS domain-containing hybrid sensor histidine kinase/response regulator [Aurantiacibacter gangjinensis]|uniref:PAS domain-containing hybrid sensor histidine kinase/response regulator n=1 Tax=Aurantiacibacter gangjinensis TaxID=502682 RepID=UPI00069C4AD2|nr:ATP-binding protein [Aurantiacibacter gangjinensis]APE28622.1 sensor histidine kinase/response regulator [Aurantiacibacter gangjinensis]
MVEYAIIAIALVAASAFALLYYRDRRQKQAGEHAALSFATLTGVAPAGIWRTDANGHCVYVNRHWEEMAGLGRGEWRDTGWSGALHPEDADRVFASFMRAVANEELFEDEWRWKRPDGSSLWVMCRGAPEYGEDGELLGYVGINIDIQRAKELEEDLSAALETAESAASAKATFLANMSHEIRTPMNGVIGFTEMLLESDLDDEQFAQVQLISDSGRAMMRLLNDILDVSKIESGQLRIMEEPTDLRQQLRHCAKLHEPMARGKGLTLGTFVDDAVPQTVMLDRLRVRQVVLNLIGNAVKFTERGGVDVEARVETSSEGPVLSLSVIDTGIGIEADRMDVIFKPFTQEDGSVARRYGGTGLGLAISSQLVTMMDGRITVQSRPGIGTAFTVRLPLKEAANEDELEEVQPAAKSVLGDLSGARVLIAEDHAINQQLIMAMIASLDIDARLVENGEEAVAAAVQARDEGRPFDVVLMDMQMPDVDGLEATRRLRALGFTAKELPVIALTANCYPDDVAACTRAGMQSHLGKPVTTVALARELARWLSPADEASAKLKAEITHESAAPEAMARPSLAGLEARYRDRRTQLVRELRLSLESEPAAIDWEKLTQELHKLAGVAANFGDAELGEASRRLEHDLKTASEPGARRAALQREWPRFEEAA